MFVYYPGGSFVNTNANDLSALVNNSMQFIGLRGTYRVGPFGYLATPGASKEFGETQYPDWPNPIPNNPNYPNTVPVEASGHWAIMDQVQGLRWVQANIAAFGGNPDHVTIGGESAGSWSICQLLATPSAYGLFGQAILESGNCDGM